MNNTNHQKGFSTLGDMFRFESALLIHGIILAMLTDAIKREDWDIIGLILDAYEESKKSPMVKKANEYLIANPMEIIIP